MAKATTNIQQMVMTEEEKRNNDLREVEDALLKNKTAIMESLDILGHMHDRGILSMLKGLLGQGDKVLDVLVHAVDKPENTNTIKNLLLMFGVLGTLDVKHLEPLLLKINAGIARVNSEVKDKDEKKTSYFELAKSLKDPEVNRTITMALNFLKGMGEATEHREKTTNDTREQVKNTEKTFKV
ncbi:DUF1641 domain-containing protein [Falsibacillus pallidus]|uniref:DUF1641 domain-containing protein n=1 Tax=Falsibacillus pallidus TaxID=493781 RepID=UPI003D974293